MKKPSFTKPPRSHTYFTDRDLGHQFPDALIAAGLTVQRHDLHFHSKTRDEEWLAFVGEQGWVGITHNRKIRYVQAERDAVMLAGVPCSFLAGHHTHAELAENASNSTLDGASRLSWCDLSRDRSLKPAQNS